MKTIICIGLILLFVICLFIGNRLANLDKPIGIDIYNGIDLEFEIEKGTLVLAIETPVIFATFEMSEDNSRYYDSVTFNVKNSADQEFTIIFEFPDGHEETIDLEALLRAGTLNSYKEVTN